MVKAIMLSIRPKYVSMILNKTKTIEVRKRFPKDYNGWVYIYCTKDRKDYLYHNKDYGDYILLPQDFGELNGKVVARFYCDNVTEYINGGQWHEDNTFGHYNDYIKDNILEQSCLTEEELFAYCEDLAFSAIHISQLEIFDKPKELNEFKVSKKVHKCDICIFNPLCAGICVKETYSTIKTPLTKAPQSWCYVEEYK